MNSLSEVIVSRLEALSSVTRIPTIPIFRLVSKHQRCHPLKASAVLPVRRALSAHSRQPCATNQLRPKQFSAFTNSKTSTGCQSMAILPLEKTSQVIAP